MLKREESGIFVIPYYFILTDYTADHFLSIDTVKFKI